MKKKILHIVTRLEQGGTLEFFINLFSGITDDILNKFDITFALGIKGTDKSKIEEISNKKGVKIYYIKELIRNINPYYDLIAFFKILKFIKKEKFDIVYTHTSKAGFLARLACFFSRVPAVYCPHGNVFYGYFNKFISYLIVLAERFLALITDRIIVFTEHERNDNLKFKIGKIEQFIIIPQGIDLKKFDIDNIDIQDKKREFNILNNEKVIGVIARLVPVKGHIYFFNALSEVVKNINNVRALIVGDGILRNDLEKKVKELGLEKFVLFLGNRNDIPEIMSICDIIVLPSLNEGFGLSLVEAQSCGKPVVATSVGGIPGVVKDKETGLLVNPRDSDALASAIISILSDDVILKEFGQKAKILAESRFNLHNMVDRWFNLI